MKFNKRISASVLAGVLTMGSMSMQVIAEEMQDNISDAQSLNYSVTSSQGYLQFNEATQMITGYIDEGSDDVDLVIPSSINGVYVLGIDNGAFEGWDNLRSVVMEEGIETIGENAFKNCEFLRSIEIACTVTEIGDYAFYGDGALHIVKFAEESELTTIGESAFSYCDMFTISIPASVTTIERCAFKSCELLYQVYFRGNAPANMDSAAFSGCTEDIMNIYFYTGNTGFTTPTWLGYNCEEIEYSITVDEDTNMLTGYVDNVEPVYLNGVLQNPVNLTIPSYIEGIDQEAFLSWERLGSVTIENGVEYIGVSAFEDCTNIKNLYIPNTVTYIDEYAFYYTTSLEDVVFESNSQLALIGYMAFSSSGFSEITIPESVGNIHEKAFRNCTNLLSVYFEGNAPQNLEEDQNAFSGCSSDLVFYFYEGKTGYTTPTWLGRSCVMIRQGVESKTWNFSDALFNSLDKISSNITVDGLTILADSNNYVQVKSIPKSLNGVTYNYCLSLRGKGATTYRAVKLDVTGNCNISVKASSSSETTRTLNVVKSDGTLVGTIAVGASLSDSSVSYTGDAESLYIYSASSGINIYEIAVN